MLAVILWIVSIILAIYIAKLKNRSLIIWGLLAVLFGFIAPLIVLCLPMYKDADKSTLEKSREQLEEVKNKVELLKLQKELEQLEQLTAGPSKI